MEQCMKSLYTYLYDHLVDMREEWLSTIENSSSNYYSINKSSDSMEELVTAHQILLENVIKVFIEEEEVYSANISKWAVKVAEKRAKDLVPILESIEQLNTVKEILLSYVEKFSAETTDQLTITTLFEWIRLVQYAFDLFVNIFIGSYDEYKFQQLTAQQETIYELSSPVIPITKGIGVLPLIGDIDTKRAQLIMENTLKECNEKRFNHLFIDLSGVPLIDTMVAHQIFHVIHALRLIGVKGYLSGLRPEVAQTAIQLGVDFSQIPIFNNLASALERFGLMVNETKFV
ncbi:STAS domain-containing protein [Niallia sp. Sow4_A1]|uniref:STAS domain-containing protein n=1 Tax=Niallia hominis TaxID=3133173 RepID=A0ABV1EYH1_9BACI|nr:MULTISPECIES: STAS domain-containing protein [unclassified Bacillus (in: firmicutes)]CAI9385652.1 RsbT co-antagonist protein RsbRD [Bacillus sp. T2.9-1]